MKRRFAAIAIAALTLAAAASAVRAQTPTPEPTLEPTPTPAPGTYIDIEVIHDLNNDGARQADEPGVEGVTLYGGCSDALIGIAPTDVEGKTRLLYVSPYQGRVMECIRLQHRFGWLETTTPFLQYDFPEGEQHGALFLVHDLNPDVMEVLGEPIVNGLPAPDAAIGLAAPYANCIERQPEYPYPLLYIVGAARSGCPAPGAQVQFLLDGIPAGAITYTAGTSQQQDLVAGGESMRMYGSYISGATIDGVECGVVQEYTGGLTPPGSVRVFVLSDEVRAGCGAPGRLVRFYRDGAPLDPLVPWRAGRFEYPDVPEFVPARPVEQQPDIIAPNTGRGSARDPLPLTAVALAGTLAVMGLSLIARAAALRWTIRVPLKHE